MSPEKWNNIVGQIEDNFEVEEKGKQHEDDMGGIDIEFVIFKGPLGRMKLEFVVKPVVLDKKTTYSRRIGAETKVDYVYSDTEKSHKMRAYKWDEGEERWAEMDARAFDN
ncbi:hypothetical protein KAU19_03570 [Candidatus Parcubacteria bacterium]|nr:hypothetical protein [Candidatus Parcubacteria bacterium]